MNKPPRALRPFGWKDRVGYMLGNVANDFTFIFASLYLQVFYTDVLGINAALVGTMFLLSRIVDAFTDTAMGRICDKAKATKNGKFKPWLLRACGPVALASLLMYQTFAVGLSDGVKIAFMFATYLLWGSVCYTAINIPYGSMASVMSNEPDDRASLSTFRGLGSLIPQILMGVVAPSFLLTKLEDGSEIANAAAFPIVALVTSILAVGGYIACYFMCTERMEVTEKAKSVSFKDTLKALAGNRALIGISLVFIGYLGAQMLNQTINTYIFKDYFGDAGGLKIVNGAGFAPAILLAPFAVPLARKFGKRELGIFASLVGAVAFGLLFLLHTGNMWVYIVISTLGLLGFGLFNLIIWAFVSDVIDDQEVVTGKRDDGTIYAVCSFARKMGQAIASALGGWALSWIGYQEAAEGVQIVQTQAVKDGIYNIATLVPMILYIAVGVCLLVIYPLSKKKVNDNAAALKEKRGE